MPIIDLIGRKKPSIRILIITIYLLLSVGGVTMVYLYILMLSTSITTEVDRTDYRIVPTYLYNRQMLLRKYLFEKYNTALLPSRNNPALDEVYGTDYLKWDEIRLPEVDFTDSRAELRVRDWREFRESLPERYKQAGFTSQLGVVYKVDKLYQRMVSDRFGEDIKKLNKAYVEEHERFMTVLPPEERYLQRAWYPKKTTKQQEWEKFKDKLPEEYKVIISVDGLWQTWLSVKYDKDISLFNERHNTNYRAFSEIPLLPALPDREVERGDWIEFVKQRCPLHYLKVTRGQEEYQEFLKNRYDDNIEYFNKVHETSFASFSEIVLPLPGEETAAGRPSSWEISLVDWGIFVEKELSPEFIEVESTENLYRGFLKTKYGQIEVVNGKYGTDYNDWLKISAPYRECDLKDLSDHELAWRWYFLTNNYAIVINYILFHGPAVVNTIIYCVAMILSTLTITPLCAFALSRFNLRSTDKILLFLLATMAFPAEVAMIPNFLLLKELRLLNTYWALILPGMASGFSIFLLKGFFDSLPRELYEAATMDGASEIRMLWQITMPLAKPILAFLALGAFTGAYGAFMFAFIVCQDPGKWTLMVWLYNMNEWAPASVQMAAFTLATVPTLLVFVFAQKVIMQGIILPVEQ